MIICFRDTELETLYSLNRLSMRLNIEGLSGYKR